jgi:hypothetical protein
MQRTKHGPNEASPLISVFDGRLDTRVMEQRYPSVG